MQYSVEQVVELCKEAGFTGEGLVTAVSIAIAESNLNTEALGDVTLENETWGPSVGFFQIRSEKVQQGTGGVRDELANLDALTNCKHAFLISENGTNFSPWSTFANGAFRQHESTVREAIAKLYGGSGASASTETHPSTTPVSTTPEYYKVVSNDMLSEIATKHGLTLDEIMKLNPQIINANRIYVGEEVRVK